MMRTLFFLIGLSLSNLSFAASKKEFIRIFDLGGSGLKTAVIQKNGNKFTIVRPEVNLGYIPENFRNSASDWIRIKVPSIEEERAVGYKFGACLASYEKLWENKKVPNIYKCMSMQDILKIPKLKEESDSLSHLRAAYIQYPKKSVLTFALGTGVALAATNSKGEIRNSSEMKALCGDHPWNVKWIKEGKFAGKPLYEVLGGGDRTWGSYTLTKEEYVEHFKIIISKVLENYKRMDWTPPQVISCSGGTAKYKLKGDSLKELRSWLDSKGIKLVKIDNAALFGPAFLACGF